MKTQTPPRPRRVVGRHRAVRLVIFALEEVYQVSEQEIVGPGRPAGAVWARQVGMTALMDQFGCTTSFAAEAFGRIDHGTALHARRAVKIRAAANHYFRAKIRQFLARLAELRRDP
jgi:chromosomal replication initiation ATPase DnaA